MNMDFVISKKKPKNPLEGMEKKVIEKARRFETFLIVKEDGVIKKIKPTDLNRRNGKK
jgi:hypothetical protein